MAATVQRGASTVADMAYGELYDMNPIKARWHLIKTYEETGSIRQTARRWHTSRQVVRKWVRRYQARGEAGLQDLSRRPHNIPRQTPSETERQVRELRQSTGYGKERLAIFLKQRGIDISPHTIRHILRRQDPVKKKKRRRRKPAYPAFWAWHVEEPFSLIQTDVKDVLDKGALGTARWDHIRKRRLPRYQWTACDSRTRLRFLAYSHSKSRTNGMAFLILTLMWLRSFDISIPVTFQTDWGEEFGGTNLDRIATLEKRFLKPLQGQLRRIPMGRSEYNGRVERSHRSDDEEFYRPYLLSMRNEQDTLALAARWVYFYNVIRPHFGRDMDKNSPLQALLRLGYNGPKNMAIFPPLLLDPISSDLLVSCDPRDGNDLLAQYRAEKGHVGRTLVRLWRLRHLIGTQPLTASGASQRT